MKGAKTVDEYLERHVAWRPLLDKLRKELLAAGFEETVKWGAPSYTIDGKNVVGLGAFKEHVALWFHQGVFLGDPDGVLIVGNEERGTKAMRQWRFTDAKQVKVTRLRVYLKEAIANQRAGKVLAADRSKPVDMPPELVAALAKRPRVRKAFESLTKGKQREYAEHIAEARREATKASRLEKILPMIEAGAGLHDKYRNC